MKLYSFSDTINNPACITGFTFIHFYTGFLFYIILKYLYPKLSFLFLFSLWFILHTLYEIKDLMAYFEFIKYKTYWSDNSIENSIFDTIATMLGLYIGYIIKYKSISFLVLNIFIYLILLLIFYINKFE